MKEGDTIYGLLKSLQEISRNDDPEEEGEDMNEKDLTISESLKAMAKVKTTPLKWETLTCSRQVHF